MDCRVASPRNDGNKKGGLPSIPLSVFRHPTSENSGSPEGGTVLPILL